MKGVELKPKKETHCSCRGGKRQAGSALPQDMSEKVKRRLNCLYQALSNFYASRPFYKGPFCPPQY